VPSKLNLHRQSRVLEIAFDTGEIFHLPCEYLRVYSPSAEVRGHGQPKLQTGKRYVNIRQIEPVGHYAVRLIFDDGHDSGLYSWSWLYELGKEQELKWKKYLAQLEKAGASRDPNPNLVEHNE
ncbi:MAG TPA: 1-(5-phosphoribosyl)-5-((5-phosphoribosylamino)methylideneamino)imidazole-4-carboxamide isomerase, partial [Gammaproteobacteria bacterium]|nr:1-(5-phosphoribosyl)-5-((5-phosphoribosylamino)methylideneamino)imidazole-4-carboxamide isomerase [Gammaproteobacteria bacterium]